MAQFYSRNLTYNPLNIAVPAAVANTIWYGYRSGYYTLDGQLYYSANNTAVLYGWQTVGAIGDQNMNGLMGIMDVDEIFEPSLGGSPYDLIGSRYPAEYSSGTYVASMSWRDANGAWSWKNHSTQRPATTTLSTANSQPVGGVNGTSTLLPYNSVTGSQDNVIGQTAGGMYIPVEGPTGTTNKFVPRTVAIWGIIANSTATTTFPAAQVEMALGDAAITFPVPVTATTIGISQRNFFFGHSSSIGSSTPQSNANPMETMSDGLNATDQHVYGTSNTTFQYTVANARGKVINVVGSALYESGTDAGEAGQRVFLARSNNYSFYNYYAALYGGVQGTDTAAGTNVRLSTKVYNHVSGTYTTLQAHKKGLSGIHIPSQAVSSNSSSYSYYQLQFNGAETGAQTISVYKPTLNLDLGTMTMGTAYTLTMDNADAAAIYNNQGHNNTHIGKWTSNGSGFRRQTFRRTWYSVSSTGTRRLHMGVYNTNGYGIVTAANGFTDPSGNGSMFKIYSWQLDDGARTATYLGASDTSAICPRYFYALDADWKTVYMGSAVTNDSVYTLNDTTGLYDYQTTMPYIAPRFFKDKEGRRAIQFRDASVSSGGIYNNYMDILTAEVGQTLVVSAAQTAFTYAGTTLTSNVQVDVYNYTGARVAKSVTLTIVGPTNNPGVTFSDNSYTKTITTSNSASTNVGIKVVSSVGAKIVGSVTESL